MRYWCYGGGNQESHCDLLLVKAIVRKLIGYQTEQANLLMFAVGGKASVHDQLGERVSLVANLRESLISRVCGYDSDLYCLFSTHIENVTKRTSILLKGGLRVSSALLEGRGTTLLCLAGGA